LSLHALTMLPYSYLLLLLLLC